MKRSTAWFLFLTIAAVMMITGCRGVYHDPYWDQAYYHHTHSQHCDHRHRVEYRPVYIPQPAPRPVFHLPPRPWPTAFPPQYE